MSKYILLILAVSFCAFELCSCLECYACVNQDGNKDKCVKTVKQCKQGEDACITVIKYGVPSYWVETYVRIHMIWKDCNKTEDCEDYREGRVKRCKRDWFNDWQCTECCKGNLCNYYVTLNSSTTKPSVLLLIFTAVFALSMLRWPDFSNFSLSRIRWLS